MLNCPPLVFIILDGFGYSSNISHNAIAAADTPQWDEWWDTEPHTLLEASGQSVGLPTAQMGNSEVGHMHIGAGRMISQDFTRINHAIETQVFNTNAAFIKTIQHVKQHKNTLHIMGLLSPGGVHSHENHLFAFLALCEQQNLNNIALHLFLDGRDTPPQSALESIKRLENKLKNTPNIRICSISGRYYALDRDKRWDRIEPVYRLLTEAQSTSHFETSEAAIHSYYQQGIYDEFIPPTQIGIPAPIENNDAIFFFNFRADRARQLTEAFVSSKFSAFSRKKRPKLSHFISMTSYAEYLDTHAAFPPFRLQDTLGEVLSKHNLRQLRVAETEKYAHVTFFLNGGTETAFQGEDRTLIPSPNVATYNLKPEMSAPIITQVILDAIQNKTHDVIICNYANADMVGHTGDFKATCAAIAALDQAMHAIGDALKPVNGQLLITADHGNAESMFDDEVQQPLTAHTTNSVPLLYVGDKQWRFKPNIQGSLVDIAPTLLNLLDIKPPATMSGHMLLIRNKSS
ncbi:MAG: 2,3-bisphosphoglycerate-independent phosphoglycerate mutase [Gammaproteobacteria bacterium]|nr:2,3-bisphosphoglycerate-independent phosphoglycerate mutase [Gammaproteobacteria bacterium]MCH9717813.1 2,3-bisphosphoglycerate-independent phosphoglycerate mutase [Gammaproteobacteria bacterium]MCH9763748.1 2,3-bisphosphoglycerate-independent phosphoglycerate mutase [Gammaproteobacteria bacterium]